MICSQRWRQVCNGEFHCEETRATMCARNWCAHSLRMFPLRLLDGEKKKSKLRGRQEAPENATHPKTQVTDRFQNLRFRVCCAFGCSLETVGYLRFRVCCVFGCFLAPANKHGCKSQFESEHFDRNKCRPLKPTNSRLRMCVCFTPLVRAGFRQNGFFADFYF